MCNFYVLRGAEELYIVTLTECRKKSILVKIICILLKIVCLTFKNCNSSHIPVNFSELRARRFAVALVPLPVYLQDLLLVHERLHIGYGHELLKQREVVSGYHLLLLLVLEEQVHRIALHLLGHQSLSELSRLTASACS